MGNIFGSFFPPSPPPTPVVMPTLSPTPQPTFPIVIPEPTLPPVGAPPEVEVFSFSYTEDETDFWNPERGLYQPYSLADETEGLEWISNDGFSLAYAYIRLDDFKDSSINAAMLEQVRLSLELAREAGLKLILRASYNFPSGATYEESQDAPLSRVLQHIQQLAPIFQENKEVIAVHQAGFVGAWGEWHSSSNNLDTEANRLTILEALLDRIDGDRMVQLRYPSHIESIYPLPLTGETAFSGTDQARTGHHNDCFLSGIDDVGTYWPIESMPEMKQYIEAMAPWVWIGGETCDAEGTRRYGCEETMGEMKRFQWDFLNIAYNEEAIQSWKNEGCFSTISKSLGYRYRIESFELETLGTEMKVEMVLSNDGWSALKNPRRAYLVLRSDGPEFEETWTLCDDMRSSFPPAGQTTRIWKTLPLPRGGNGSYEVMLFMPDDNEGLASRPEYSIRLANLGVWESNSGMNKLGSIEIA